MRTDSFGKISLIGSLVVFLAYLLYYRLKLKLTAIGGKEKVIV